ncbi:MAG: hypothetical protein RR557_04710 [Bacilli bacterium]
MIFRKPYAFLIKNFKLIHVIITICMAYLLYKTYSFNHFISEYMKTNMLSLGRGSADEVINKLMFTLPIILVLFSVVMLITMIKKEKPKTFYIFTIITFISLFILNNYFYLRVVYLEENIMPIQEVRLLLDLSLIFTIFQAFLLILSLIRAIGFDIKKFDFKQDLLDMDILDEDREEFEVSFNIEGNVFERTINKKLRNLKYSYLENKFLFITITLLCVIVTSYLVYKGGNINTKTINEGEAFFSASLNIQVIKSFMTNNDYTLEKISNNRYVAIETNILSNASNQKLNLARMELMIGKEAFYPVESGLKDKLFDLGKVYADDILTKKFQKFLIVYEIPESLSDNNMKLRYISRLEGTRPEYISIKLNPIDLDKEDKLVDIPLGKEIVLNEKTAGKSKIKINSFEIKDSFTLNYNFCLTEAECYPSIERVIPTLNSTTQKALMKVNGSFEIDENIVFGSVKNIYNIIDKFGIIVYQLNGKTYKTKGNFKNVNVKKKKTDNEFYIEVNKKMVDADYAYLLLNVRNKKYKFIIKK